jgi:hypothetical protein
MGRYQVGVLDEQVPSLSALDNFGEVCKVILPSQNAVGASLDGGTAAQIHDCSGGTVASVNATVKAAPSITVVLAGADHHPGDDEGDPGLRL